MNSVSVARNSRRSRAQCWPVVVLLLILLPFHFACSSARQRADAERESPGAAAAAPVGGLADSSVRPVVLTLRRDSLGLAAGASTESTMAAIQRAVGELKRVADFEVLAISPAILAVNVRAVRPADARLLAGIFRAHRLVASVGVAGFMERQ